MKISRRTFFKLSFGFITFLGGLWFAKDHLIEKGKCMGCGSCVAICPVNALILITPTEIYKDEDLCTNCGKCSQICAVNAI